MWIHAIGYIRKHGCINRLFWGQSRLQFRRRFSSLPRANFGKAYEVHWAERISRSAAQTIFGRKNHRNFRQWDEQTTTFVFHSAFAARQFLLLTYDSILSMVGESLRFGNDFIHTHAVFYLAFRLKLSRSKPIIRILWKKKRGLLSL